jgi:glycosyltransferase involved in cell wall biosynthesis
MAKVLAEVAKSRELREDLRNKGWENVKRFSWETTAGETRAVYDRVVEGRDQSSRGMP